MTEPSTASETAGDSSEYRQIEESSSTSSGSADRIVEGLKALGKEFPIRLTVSGQCMEPKIVDNAEIVVAPRRRYWPGDILAFRLRRGDLRVHRLIGYRLINGRFLLQTRADRTGTLDPPFSADCVIGRVAGAPERLAVSVHDRLAAIARFAVLRLTQVLPR